MNKVNILLKKFHPAFTFVSVNFHQAPHTVCKAYSYKTTLAFEVGDLAIVKDPSGEYRAVTVVAVGEAPTNKAIKYKWIVSKLDLAHFISVQALEQDIEDSIASAEAECAVKEEEAQLVSELGPELLAKIEKRVRI